MNRDLRGCCRCTTESLHTFLVPIEAQSPQYIPASLSCFHFDTSSSEAHYPLLGIAKTPVDVAMTQCVFLYSNIFQLTKR